MLTVALVMAQLPSFVLPAILPSAASAAPVIDQEQSATTSAAAVVSGVQTVAQTLTLARTGRLAEIHLALGCSSTTDATLTVEVRDVQSDGRPGAQVRASLTQPASTVHNPGGVFPIFRFGSDAPVFNAGEMVAIVAFTTVQTVGGACAWIFGPAGDPYPGGRAWVSLFGGWTFFDDYNDHAFRWLTEPIADLAVTLAESSDPVIIEHQLTYAVTVTNSGPEDAADVVAILSLPSSPRVADIVSADPDCAFESVTDVLVFCSLGTLAPGATLTRHITVQTGATGTYRTSAEVRGSTLDPNTADNVAFVETTVRFAIADLVAGISDAPDPVVVGRDLVYTATATSLGPEDAPKSSIAVELPDGVDFVAADARCRYDPVHRNVLCIIDPLVANTTETFVLTVRPTAGATITVIAAVSGNVSDPDASNNQAQASTTVNGPPPAAGPSAPPPGCANAPAGRPLPPPCR